MRLQVCRMVYEDAVGIGPESVVSWQEADNILGIRLWNVSQLVDEEELTMLIDTNGQEPGFQGNRARDKTASKVICDSARLQPPARRFGPTPERGSRRPSGSVPRRSWA